MLNVTNSFLFLIKRINNQIMMIKYMIRADAHFKRLLLKSIWRISKTDICYLISFIDCIFREISDVCSDLFESLHISSDSLYLPHVTYKFDVFITVTAGISHAANLKNTILWSNHKHYVELCWQKWYARLLWSWCHNDPAMVIQQWMKFL